MTRLAAFCGNPLHLKSLPSSRREAPALVLAMYVQLPIRTDRQTVGRHRKMRINIRLIDDASDSDDEVIGLHDCRAPTARQAELVCASPGGVAFGLRRQRFI